MQCGLASRIPGAHDKDVAAFHGPHLAPRRAVENAGADQRLQAWHPQAAPRYAGRDDDSLGGDPMAVGELHHVLPAHAFQAHGGLREHHVRAEHPGLLARPAGEVMPADAMREAGIVPDHRAVSRLAARNGLLQHHRLQAL